MKIFIICSKNFYDRVSEIKNFLEQDSHVITLPNSFDDVGSEERFRKQGDKVYSEWKARMIRLSMDKMTDVDAVLVLNFEKNGVQNYIGGATFLEMYDAFKSDKKIFMFNDVPEGILQDEIIGFNPIIIEGDLSKIA